MSRVHLRAMGRATALLARILRTLGIASVVVGANVYLAANLGAWVPVVAAVETVLAAWGFLYLVELDRLREDAAAETPDDLEESTDDAA